MTLFMLRRVRNCRRYYYYYYYYYYYCSAAWPTFVVSHQSRYATRVTKDPRRLTRSLRVTSARDARPCKSREVAWPTYVHSWVLMCGFVNAFWNGNGEIRFFCSSRSWAWNCNHRSDSSPVAYERPARSVDDFALITAPVLTFLFTGRDAAITVNSVKIDIARSSCFSRSTIGYRLSFLVIVPFYHYCGEYWFQASVFSLCWR